jgi:hypothetical protein
MKSKQNKRKNVLHFTLKYLIVKRKQEQAHNKLLFAINACCTTRELETILQFKSLHTEPLVMQVYRQRRSELEHQSAA